MLFPETTAPKSPQTHPIQRKAGTIKEGRSVERRQLPPNAAAFWTTILAAKMLAVRNRGPKTDESWLTALKASRANSIGHT